MTNGSNFHKTDDRSGVFGSLAEECHEYDSKFCFSKDKGDFVSTEYLMVFQLVIDHIPFCSQSLPPNAHTSRTATEIHCTFIAFLEVHVISFFFDNKDSTRKLFLRPPVPILSILSQLVPNKNIYDISGLFYDMLGFKE